MTNQIVLEKSEGHQAFIGKFEYFTLENGDLYRAPKAYPVMPEGSRSGRWEVKGSQIKDHMAMVSQFA